MLSQVGMLNKQKNDYLASINDTNFRMGWNNFKNLIIEKGFIPAIEYDIKHADGIDEFIIYYHSVKGLIICADSYWNKKSINSGNLYGEIQANGKDDVSVIWDWISTGGCIDKDKYIFETSHDVREGLFSKLDELESVGKFLPIWTKKDRFLWFVDYNETKIDGHDYKKITHDKIMKCPIGLQKIIGIV